MLDILTEEVINDAIQTYWRGNFGWCPFCGTRQRAYITWNDIPS
jgi:hypothetical protein